MEMMKESTAVLVFGVAIIAGAIAFAWRKLPRSWKDKVCICSPEHEGPCNKQVSCGTLKEINADFLERRNEFWFGLGQIIVIAAVVTILAVLLILEKVSSEAALPIISGLVSFALGKGVMGAKTKLTPEPDLGPAKQ